MIDGNSIHEHLWQALGYPESKVLKKKKVVLDEWATEFIKHSSFLVISTSDKNGKIYVSPRGGEPGFVAQHGNTLIIPDYIGNRLYETIGNILHQQLASGDGCEIGLIFFIPGVNELLRVIGKAKVCAKFGNSILEIKCLDEILPGEYSLKIECSQWYYHCARAIKKSNLWNSEKIQIMKDNPPISQRPRLDDNTSKD